MKFSLTIEGQEWILQAGPYQPTELPLLNNVTEDFRRLGKVCRVEKDADGCLWVYKPAADVSKIVVPWKGIKGW